MSTTQTHTYHNPVLKPITKWGVFDTIREGWRDVVSFVKNFNILSDDIRILLSFPHLPITVGRRKMVPDLYLPFENVMTKWIFKNSLIKVFMVKQSLLEPMYP